MWTPFGQTITSTEWQRVATQTAPIRPGESAGGSVRRQDPIPWNLIVGARASAGGAYSGVRIRVRAIMGDQEVRVFTVDDVGRRWSGRAVAVEVEAQLIAADQSAQVQGGLGFDPDAGAEVSGTPTVTNLITRYTISLTQATTDGAITGTSLLGEIQRETRRLALSIGAMSLGTAEAYQVVLWGRRTIDLVQVRLGSILASLTTPNSGVLDLVPGQFDRLFYSLTGTTAAEAATATLYVTEEIGAE